jgi:pimeloyl-[acyl-carrier protein] methyl ester esterase
MRVVIGHSLGPHLLSGDVWRTVNVVILLASFGTFVPPDKSGRRARAALDGMAAQLGNQEHATSMLEKFLANAAAPEPVGLMPPSPLDGPLNLSRLVSDLEILRRCHGLPDGFPSSARVLIVEAGEDRIVAPETQAMLREQLPAAEVIRLPGAGHALLRTDVVSQATRWIASRG